jgi:hypothetical protein
VESGKGSRSFPSRHPLSSALYCQGELTWEVFSVFKILRGRVGWLKKKKGMKSLKENLEYVTFENQLSSLFTKL